MTFRESFEKALQEYALKGKDMTHEKTALWAAKWALEKCLKILDKESNPYLIDAEIRKILEGLK